MIVDESVWSLVTDGETKGWRIVRESLQGCRNAQGENHKLHVGGSYWREKVKSATTFRQFVLALGPRVILCNEASVDAAEAKWKACKGLKCDHDQWALALAEVSSSRLLAANDKGLKADFQTRLKGKVICPGRAAKPLDLVKCLRTSS